MKKSLINLMSVLIALAMVLTSTAVFVSAEEAGEENTPTITLSSEEPTTFSYGDLSVNQALITANGGPTVNYPTTTGKPDGTTTVTFYLWHRTVKVVAPEAGRYKLSLDEVRVTQYARAGLEIDGQFIGLITPETGTDKVTFLEAVETYVYLKKGENTLTFGKAGNNGLEYKNGNNVGLTTVTFDYLGKDTVGFNRPTVETAISNGGVRAYVNATDANNTVLILAAYGNDNTLLSVKYFKENLATDGAVITIGKADRDIPDGTNIKTIRAFLWKGDTLAPLNNVASIQ